MYRLGAAMLRFGGFVLSCLAYSYLELLDVRGQGSSSNNGSKGFTALLASSLGELAPGLEEAVPPILKRLWLNHLPFLLLLLLTPALLLPGTSLLGVNAALFHGCLLAAALRDPAVPSSSSSTDAAHQQGGAWTSVLSLGLFLLSAAVYWAEPGGGGAQSGDKVRFRPYEAEIRQLLLKHDPGRLHLVDGMLRAHRWNPRRLFKELQAEYVHHAPPPPRPAAAAASTSAARRPPSARSTTTSASAASSVHFSPQAAAAMTTAAAAAAYQQYAGAGISRGSSSRGARVAAALPPPSSSQSQRVVYGAYDEDEEEFYDDAQGITATGAAYAQGEEKASAAYTGAGRYLPATTTTQQQQQREYPRGSAVSAVMEASRAYQEGILARQQERIRALHVSNHSSPPAPRSYTQPAGSPGRAAGAGGNRYCSAYSQR